MQVLKKAIVLLFIFPANANVHSSTVFNREVNCPLCDTVITYWGQSSYSIFTYGLDLKPMGAAFVPQPIPKCGNCGFAFIEDYFTGEEIQQLKKYIIDQNIFSGKEKYPAYYYLALAVELAGRKDYEEIAYFYVCSVWEYSRNKLIIEYAKGVEIENLDGIYFDHDIFMLLMRTAVEKINNLDRDSEEFDNMQLVKLDFLRRLGLFNEAKRTIENIKNNKRFYREIVTDIVAHQIRLIKNKDMDEHNLEEMNQE
jgi:hypothetical protein